MIAEVAVQSLALTAAVLASYIWALNKYSGDLLIARTFAFATLISAELIRAYSCRSERYSLIKLGIFSNKILVWASMISFLLMLAVIYIPFLQPIFETYALSGNDWLAVASLCAIPLLAGEIYKPISNAMSSRTH